MLGQVGGVGGGRFGHGVTVPVVPLRPEDRMVVIGDRVRRHRRHRRHRRQNTNRSTSATSRPIQQAEGSRRARAAPRGLELVAPRWLTATPPPATSSGAVPRPGQYGRLVEPEEPMTPTQSDRAAPAGRPPPAPGGSGDGRLGRGDASLHVAGHRGPCASPSTNWPRAIEGCGPEATLFLEVVTEDSAVTVSGRVPDAGSLPPPASRRSGAPVDGRRGARDRQRRRGSDLPVHEASAGPRLVTSGRPPEAAADDLELFGRYRTPGTAPPATRSSNTPPPRPCRWRGPSFQRPRARRR